MKSKIYITIVFFITSSYSSSGFTPKDTTENKKIVEKVKTRDDYDFDVFFGLGLLQILRVGTNIYITDNTTVLLTYAPAVVNAYFQSLGGGGGGNEFESYSIGMDYEYNNLSIGLEFLFKENFHPYNKSLILAAPKFIFKTNPDKKIYVLINLSPYFSYYSNDNHFRVRGVNLGFDVGIRY